MALPKVLKFFNTFQDGENWVGLTPEVTLPKLSRKMEAYRAGGMPGEVDLDLGVEKLEAKITWGGLMTSAIKTFGTAKVDGVLLRFAGSYQEDGEGTTSKVEAIMRGRYKELDPGNAKAGDKSENTGTLSLSYYKLTVDGEVIYEIDMVNMIENAGGTDRLAEHKANIGL